MTLDDGLRLRGEGFSLERPYRAGVVLGDIQVAVAIEAQPEGIAEPSGERGRRSSARRNSKDVSSKELGNVEVTHQRILRDTRQDGNGVP